ncbi:MAG: hypothetical protein IH944_07070 [Armatimonadetes bacterium]|nr:hypothetical protein [Armatimonadota bacterium]
MGARKWVIGGFLAAVLLVVGLWAFSNLKEEERNKTRLATALARAESLGVPIYTKQLYESPILDDENAWVEINEIDRLYDENSDNWPSASEFSRISDRDEFLAGAAVAIQQFEPIYQQVQLLMLKEKYVVGRDWERGVAMLMSDLGSSKQAVTALCVRARYRLFNDDVAGSIDDLNSANRISALLGSERSLTTVIAWLGTQKTIASEVIRHGSHAISEDHKSQLESVLDALFQPIDLKTLYEQEIVLFLDSMRMVSDENKNGNQFRKNIDDIDMHSLAGKIEGSSLSASAARKFEILGIQAACDFYEKLSSRVEDYVKNDEQYTKFVEHPTDWVAQGFPYGFYEIMDHLGLFDASLTIGPYRLIARRAMVGELYQKAFEIATGSVSLDDGAKWQSKLIDGAEFEFLMYEGGFSITVTAPDLDPVTLKFDQPE